MRIHPVSYVKEANLYPRKLAAVDVGSNAIRFAVAEVVEPGRLEPVESSRIALRLGTDAFGPGSLQPATLDAAVEALQQLRRRMDELGIVWYRAVATSATRESSNGEELVRRAWEEAGVRLEVLSGEEEARLIWRAVRERGGAPDGSWVLVDLGGGSVEVARTRGDEVEWTVSRPLGTVKLLSEGAGKADAAASARKRISALATAVRERLDEKGPAPAGMLATGGNIEALATLAGVPPASDGPRVLGMDALRKATARLEELSVEARQSELGLAPDRADVILPASVVYAELAEAVGVEEIHIPDVGLKEGVLLELADTLAGAERSETRIAFVSDVHGNALALREAIRMAEQAGAGRVLMAGDAVGDGPQPVEVIRMLREHHIESIRGNVDRKVVRLSRKKRKKLAKLLEGKNGDTKNRAWTALQLKDAKEERAWLDERPEQFRLELGGQEVLVVHGSPRGDTDYLLPSLTPAALALKLEPLGDAPAPAVLVSGHSHIPFVNEVEGVLLVNCGSCGRPKDGDWRGTFAMVELDGKPSAEVVRFDYPLGALVAELGAREVPGVTAKSYHLGIK